MCDDLKALVMIIRTIICDAVILFPNIQDRHWRFVTVVHISVADVDIALNDGDA